MRNYLLIYVNGRRLQILGEKCFKSLSDFLRHDLGLVGTKVVCAEGDCGSCTVLVGRISNGELKFEGLDSCIQYLYQLDCTASYLEMNPRWIKYFGTKSILLDSENGKRADSFKSFYFNNGVHWQYDSTAIL